jgi:hypothetical protein
MLAYLWFCVMLRAVSPGADVILTRYNQAMEAFMTAGLIGERPDAAPVYSDAASSRPRSQSEIIAENGAVAYMNANARSAVKRAPAAAQLRYRRAARKAEAWSRSRG